MDDEKPDWSKECDCGATVERYRGQGDVTCANCGAQFNAFGQRLRDDWRGNPSSFDDEIGDLEGFELQQLRYEQEAWHGGL